MKKSIVALMHCDSYESKKVREVIKKGILLVGGMSSFFKKGESIVLKPNLLKGAHHNLAMTTHPAIFEAVIQEFMEFGLKLSYGDSPGVGKPENVAAKTGLADIAHKHSVTLSDFTSNIKTTCIEPCIKKTIPLAKGVLDADGLVSLSKMKSHGFVRMTGAVKNQYGCITGLNKPGYHAKIPMANDFASFVVDINLVIKPRLYIMDAIIAMEGNGPMNGDPTPMNCILISKDPVALDAIACQLMDLNPDFVPTCIAGQEKGLGTFKYDSISVVGEPVEKHINKSFNVIRKPVFNLTSKGIIRTIKSKLMPKPIINNDICISCGQCEEICPVNPKALLWKVGKKKKSPPYYSYSNCIRCFCCQETCPAKAITIKTSKLEFLLIFFSFMETIGYGFKIATKNIGKLINPK